MLPAAFCLAPLAAVGPQRAVTGLALLRQHSDMAQAAEAPCLFQQGNQRSFASREQLPQLRSANVALAAFAAATVSTTRQGGRSIGHLMKYLQRSVRCQQQSLRSRLAAATGRPVSNEGLPQWEFCESNARVFSRLAKAMRVVSMVFLVKAVAVHGLGCFGTYLLHSNPELIYSDIFGEMAEMFDYICFSFFLWKAASDINAIANSTGSDITFLMRGVAALLAFFQCLIIVGGILILKGVSTTTGHMFDLHHLKARGIAVQNVATPPFGFVPPAWCFPLGFFGITIFMVVLGRKSLWDDYGQIVPYMQPKDK